MTTPGERGGGPMIYNTGKDTWTHDEKSWSLGLSWDRKPIHCYLGPCPLCGARTFDYGGGWRCLAPWCFCSDSNPMPSMGPAPVWWNSGINVIRDGDAWCAHRADFINLQESDAGYGASPQEAVDALIGVAP